MPSRLYSLKETAIAFKKPGPVLLTLAGLTTGNGRVSDRWDRYQGGAAGAYANRFMGRAKIKLAVAAVVGVTAAIYLVTSDGTDSDGGLGTGDAALPALDRRRNLTQIATIVADAATVGPFFAPISIFEFDDRYMQILVVNEMGQSLTAVDADHYVNIWSVPLENQ
jgi:hypothetical protein